MSRTSTSRHSSSEPEPPNVVEREVADVEATLHGDLPQRIRLIPRGDLEDAGRAGLRTQFELAGELRDAVERSVHIERDLATQQVRRDAPEHDASIRDRDVGASGAVAQRPGMGAGRLWSDLERALRRQPGDRASARANRDDVDHGDLAGEGTDAALGGERRLAVDDDRDVGGRAAAIAGEHAVEAGGASRSARRRARRPPGRTARS